MRRVRGAGVCFSAGRRRGLRCDPRGPALHVAQQGVSLYAIDCCDGRGKDQDCCFNPEANFAAGQPAYRAMERAGGLPARYMGMPGMKAQHITLVLEGADPHFEIQLLEFDPAPGTDPGAHPTNLRQRGFNHLAFRSTTLRRPPRTSWPTA